MANSILDSAFLQAGKGVETTALVEPQTYPSLLMLQ